MTLAIGDSAPAFDLPGTDGATHAAGGPSAAPVVVVFTCNHCPYALAWHERIARLARDYAGRGVRVLNVNPNDAGSHPRDSFDAMRERVAADPHAWPMPYLRDEDQAVARAYGARTTPDVFVLDAEGRLAYRGAPDADHDDEALDARWVRDALDALLGGRPVERPQTEPVGCSVKWRG
jgi:peroxiredoxin